MKGRFLMIHVMCASCGEFEIVGPGHPAMRANPDTGQQELHDRSALLPGCDCPDDGEGSRPLKFTFMAGSAPATLGA
jgi:hypothetical protein